MTAQQFPNSFGRPETVLSADYTPGDGVLHVADLPIGVAETGPIFQVKIGATIYKVTDLGTYPFLDWEVPDGAVEGTADFPHVTGTAIRLELTREAMETLRTPTYVTVDDETESLPNSISLEDMGIGSLGSRLHGDLTDIDPNQHHPRLHSHSSGSDGTILRPNVIQVASTFALAGYMDVPQITSNKDDFTPTGGYLYTIWRIYSDASRNITGINQGQDAGRILVLFNVGSFNIVLKHQNMGSVEAGNRFICTGGADLTLVPYDIGILIYDWVDGRWRVGKLV